MKFKKLIAALSTVTMLGTLAMSVPVSAKAVSGDTGAVAATVSAQVRANDSAFTDRNRVEIKTGASGGIEMTQKSGVYFGAYYSFKKLDIPEGAKIDSATLTITKYDAFTDRKFNVIALNVTDAESTNGETIFNAVSSAYSTATVVTANETERNNTAPIVADVTTIFDKSKDNTFFVTNQMVESSKRQLKPDATLQVKYTYEEPDEPVAQIGTKKYASFEGAFVAAKSDNTITLLTDVETDGRFVLDSGNATAPTYRNNINNLTIDGNGHKITTTGSYDFLFETNKKNLTLNNITVVNNGKMKYVVNAKINSTITIDGAAVPAPVFKTNDASSTIKATNLNVTNAANDVSLFAADSTLGTVNINLTEELAAQYDVVDGVLTAKAVEPEKHAEYFSFKGENGISYNTLTATAEKDGNKDTKSTPIMTITDVTDIVVSVTDIPEGITITGIVLDSIAPVE